MTISTKGRYGLRLLIDIAVHQKDGIVRLKDIAERQSLSIKYLWQIINPLKAAGLVRVTRGARGGFVLAKEPEAITVLDVVSIMEGPVALVECVATRACSRVGTCAAHVIWSRLTKTMVESMESVTLAEAVGLQCQAPLTDTYSI